VNVIKKKVEVRYLFSENANEGLPSTITEAKRIFQYKS